MERAAVNVMNSTEPLSPSKLGTKEHWDEVYVRELHNHEEDPEDEGTIWFDESNAEDSVLKELDKLESNSYLHRRETQPLHASRFLDLGTGNGHMLFLLCEDDEERPSWTGDMVGVDYSNASVQLARRIAAERFHSRSGTLQFEQWNVLSDPPGDWLKDGFDVVLDKGTFDAISLMRHNPDTRHPCNLYRTKVAPLVKPGCFLFVTSCNWTKNELIQWLAPASGGELTFHSEAKYPTFTFGGQTGQSVVTISFQRRRV